MNWPDKEKVFENLTNPNAALNDSLFTNKDEGSANKTIVVDIDVDRLERGKYQCRKIFLDLEELANSIEELGIAQPLLVRPISSGNFEIIAGERRWRAAQLACFHKVPCIIRNCDDKEAWQLALHENIQRDSLTAIEEARGYFDAIEEWNLSHAQVAKMCGVSREKVSNRLRLLSLPVEVQLLIEDRNSHLEAHHGINLATPKLNERQKINIARNAERQKWSVAQLDKAIKRITNPTTNKNIDADIHRLEDVMSINLGCDVKISNGKIVIAYHRDLDILDGLLDRIGIEKS